MVEPADIEELRRRLGRDLARIRAAAGHTQETLAPQVGYSRSSLANVEVGRQQVPRSFWALCDQVLKSDGQLLSAYDHIDLARKNRHREQPPSARPIDEHRAALIDVVRSAILLSHPTRAPSAALQPRQIVEKAHLAYQHANYSRAATLMPALAAVSSPALLPAAEQRNPYGIVVAAHLAMSKLAIKAGDAQLAWIAADRAMAYATTAASLPLLAAAQCSVGRALLALPGRQNDAAAFVEDSLSRIDRKALKTPVALSATGALTLMAAVISARSGQHAATNQHLGVAAKLAGNLDGDRNDLWTGFGPTNVLIHQVTTATAYAPEQAIAIGEKLDTSVLPKSLVSRRSQVHLDLASAFTQVQGGDASAVLHLLQIEQTAPQLLRVHPPAGALILKLLSRERRAATPGLRPLAQRTGLAV